MTDEVLNARAIGSVIRITVNDDSVAEVREMGFDRIMFERSTDLGLSWAEITTPDSRPVIEATKPGYAWVDRSGSTSYLYRTKYFNSRTGEEGDPSADVAGEGIVANSILPVAVLKTRYLFGVDFTNDAGEPLPDAVWQHYIMQAVEWFEHQLDIRLSPTTIIESQDYYANDYNAFNFIQLDEYPVISVETFSVKYPTGQTIVEYPAEWIHVDKNKGHLRIVPTAGTLSQILIGSGGSFLPVIYSGMSLPDLFEIEYTAGFERIPANILDLVGMFAALGPLNIFGDLIAGAGIANLSLSLDGLSQSIGTTASATNAGYGSRIIQYLKQIKEQIPLLRKYYKGIRMVVA